MAETQPGQPVRVDQLPSHEHASLQSNNIGLEVRLLMGGNNYNPNHVLNIHDINVQALGNIDTRDYSRLNQRSYEERARANLDYQTWSNGIMASLTSDNSKRFFNDTDQGKRWNQFLKRQLGQAGINIDTVTLFNQTMAQNLYDHYFTGTNKASDEKKFVGEVLNQFKDQSGAVNLEQLDQNKDAIRWFASMFGQKSAKTLMHMIMAEAKNIDPQEKTKLVMAAKHTQEIEVNGQKQQVLRTNPGALKNHEIEILEFISGEKYQGIKSSPEPDDESEKIIIKVVDRPKTNEELVKIINTQDEQDEPIIIKTEEAPKKETFVIDLRPTLEHLGKAQEFGFKNRLDQKTDITDLIPLKGISGTNGEYNYFCVRQMQPNGIYNYSSCMVMKDRNGRLIAVGHVDYGTNLDKPDEAGCCMSNIQTITAQINNPNLPDYLKTVNDHFCPSGQVDVAVKIDNRFKGKNLGKHLWYLALSQAEKDGIKQINIYGDATIGQKPNSISKSFYEHLGAKTKLYIQPLLKLDGSPDELIAGEQLFASTYLTDNQIKTLQKVFESQQTLDTIKIPNVEAAENHNAAERFISTLRDPANYAPDPHDTRIKHKLGFHLARSPENDWFYSDEGTQIFETRYNMPLALYISGDNPLTRHANLLLKPPYQEAGVWKIKVYNPMIMGEQEIELTNYDPTKNYGNGSNTHPNFYLNQNLRAHRIESNSLALNTIKEGKYNLALSDRPEIKDYLDTFIHAKLQALQLDGKNCVPYSCFVGALLQGLQPGETEFKKTGLAKFHEDFGIRIRPYEEIMGLDVQ